MSLEILLPLGLALLPGIVVYWTGRGLAARADDPELPDLLLARSGRVNSTFLGCLVAVILVPGGGPRWIALLLPAFLAGSYPLRRALYGETWGVGGYMLWWARSVGAGLALLLGMQFTPLLVVEAYPYHWAAAGAAGLVLTAMALNQTRLWLWAHGATPLDRPALRARFDEVVRRAGSVVPAVYRIGPRGGTVANAFALPSARTPAVIFGDTLLDLLQGDEADAVFAHELAHLEQYDARRLRRNRVRAFAAIAAVLALPLAMVALGSRDGVLAMFLGAWLVLAVLWNRASQAQADETAADRRAAELVGDPEAVIRGLTRIHQYSRLPRRWPPEMEGGATHPSLARRVAALRGESAAAPPLLATAAVVPSPREGSWVAFDQRRVSFFEGVPAGTRPAPAALHEAAASARSVAYAELADLRLRTAGDAPVLAATDRAGLSWTFPVFPADVESLRRIVHEVDVQLGTVRRPPSTTAHRAFALLALVVAALAGGFGVVLLPALLAVAWPGAVSLAALGAVALARAALAAADGTARWGSAGGGWYLAALAAVGIGLLAVSVFRAPDRENGPCRPGRILGPLAALAAVFLLQVGMAAADRGVDWGAGEPAAALPGLLMLGVGAGMLRLRRPALHRGGAAVAAAGLAPLVLALGTDRLSGAQPDIAWSRGTTAAATASTPLAGYAQLAQVSPSGRAFLLRADASGFGPRGATWNFTVGGFAGLRRAFPASAAALAGDAHVLVLADRDGATELRMEPLAGGAPLWRRVLPPLVRPEVAADGAGGWTVWGRATGAQAVVLLAGGPYGPVRTLRVAQGQPLASALPLGDGLLVLRRRDGAGGAGLPWPLRLDVADAWEMVHADAAGERVLATLRGFPNCSAPDGRAGVVCEVVDGRRGTLWSVAPGGRVRRVGDIPPDLFELSLQGGVLASTRWSHEVVVIDPAGRRGRRIRLPGVEYAQAAYPVDGGVAVLHDGDAGPVLSLFRTSAAP